MNGIIFLLFFFFFSKKHTSKIKAWAVSLSFFTEVLGNYGASGKFLPLRKGEQV